MHELKTFDVHKELNVSIIRQCLPHCDQTSTRSPLSFLGLWKFPSPRTVWYIATAVVSLSFDRVSVSKNMKGPK